MSQAALSQMAQLHATLDSIASQAAQQPTLASAHVNPKTPPSGTFADALGGALRAASAVENHANTQAQAFELGTPGVSLNDVMVDLQKANLALQTTVQMRNRLVAAYQEIASMSV